ncbi:MAG: tetratricopeptide repeat protein [Candidatus Delongbacteria bacterium]|nr:tetratricopeptide repeat protein [Candidatus Delongbacteria bacterium]
MLVRKLKYPPEFKKDVCETAKKENIICAAKAFGLTRKTVSKWLRIYIKSDVTGLSVRKIRFDSGSGLINPKTASKIFKFKKKYPKATYEDIKKKFCLDCSPALISRKLKSIKREFEKKGAKKRIFYLGYRVYRGVNKSISKFRLELYDDLSGLYYLSHSDGISKNYFSSFVRDVKFCLEKEGYNSAVSRIISNVKYLYDDLQGIPVEYDCGSKHKLSRIKPKIGYDIPINISSKIRYLCVNMEPAENEKAICVAEKRTAALMQLFADSINKFGDEFYKLYDLDNALRSYRNLYDLSYGDDRKKSHMIRSLYRQADIYYHKDKYTTTKQILYELVSSKDRCCENYNEGHIYYYLGKISELENDLADSQKYFSKASKIFYASGKEFYFDYLKSSINKNIVSGMFRSALDIANKFVKNALTKGDHLLICSAYDLRGRVYFLKKQYGNALKDFGLQMESARENGLSGEEIKAISNLLSVYVLGADAEFEKIENMISRAEFLSKFINDETLMNHIYQLLGNHYFYKKKYLKAVECYDKTTRYYLIKKNFMNYSASRHYLGLSFFYMGKYSEAAAVFKEVSELELSDLEFRIHSMNFAGRSLMYLNKTREALSYFKLSAKNALLSGNGSMHGDALKCIGKLYKTEGNYKKSTAYYSRALRLFKKLYRTGRNEFTKGNIEECRENLQELEVLK